LFLDIVSNLLPFLQQILQDKLSTGVLEDGVGDLSDGKTEVLNAIVGEPRIYDFVVNCCVDVDGHVVLGDDILIVMRSLPVGPDQGRGSWCLSFRGFRCKG
jgi:hypothetical protein